MTKNILTEIKRKPKKPTAEKEEKPIKLTGGMIEEYLVRFLVTGKPQLFMPAFLKYEPLPVNFCKIKAGYKARAVTLNPETGIATELDDEMLTGMIHKSLARFAIEENPCHIYRPTHNVVKSLAAQLVSAGNQIKEWPQPCGFKGEPGYFFLRHKFDPAPRATPADFPTIQLNLEHMTNARNFCERIGSLYDPEANRKQIIMMIGGGDGGKSALLNLITDLAGGPDGVASIDMSVFKDFGFAPLVDKRVWLGEELSPKFFKDDSKFKKLTGGSPVPINQKNEKQYSAYLKGMLFCASNKVPEIKDDSGVRNRLIICEVEPIPKWQRLPPEETQRRMRAELPYFVRYCMDAYERVDGDGTLKPDTTEKLDSIIADGEMDFEAIFDEYFYEDLTKIGKDATVTISDYKAAWVRIVGNNKGIVDQKHRKEFDDYVKKRLGRTSLAIPVFQNNKTQRKIAGLSIR